MIDITFITSNPTKLAHARHLCKEYEVNILQYKELFYGVGYEEPRLFDRNKLIEESINDAIVRWKKNVSNSGNRLFFIEDTSVRIDALSDENNEVPGVDIKYWMQSSNFLKLDTELKRKGNNRKVSVSSHIILFLTDELKKKYKKKFGIDKDHVVFKSTSYGTIVLKEQEFEIQVLYPWLDNKTFNKWFVPDGFDVPISMLEISQADGADFRKGAFEKMLNFLNEYGEIKITNEATIIPKIQFNPIYIICGPTCAGKSTIGRYLVEQYKYYHIEASDFMSLRYFETHGTKFTVDKNLFAAELLKVNPYFVVESIISYIISKKIFDNFLITGFRTLEEVKKFYKMFPSQNIKSIFITADSSIRYNRWINRKRDVENYSQKRFEQINNLQNDMGLSKVKEMDEVIIYENNKEGLSILYKDFTDMIMESIQKYDKVDLNQVLSISKMTLEKAILFILAIEYRKNESNYYTTTEISHLINNSFVKLEKSKNNVSRYFNQKYYPFYEIKKESGKNKYKLSPTGYSEAISILHNLKL